MTFDAVAFAFGLIDGMCVTSVIWTYLLRRADRMWSSATLSAVRSALGAGETERDF